METPITTWSGGADFKAFVAGYPQFDEANKKVTTRGIIASTEANGNTITEVGEFNDDGTEVMFSHDVFTGIVKTSSIEVIIEWVHEAVNP